MSLSQTSINENGSPQTALKHIEMGQQLGPFMDGKTILGQLFRDDYRAGGLESGRARRDKLNLLRRPSSGFPSFCFDKTAIHIEMSPECGQAWRPCDGERSDSSSGDCAY